MSIDTEFDVVANVVHIAERQIVPQKIVVQGGRVVALQADDSQPQSYVLPGFIDSHVHVESSMLVPSEFANAAVRHGTVATVSDPHEIANVLGIPGVEFMLENAATVPFKFWFGAPSCVPATSFETSGATIDANGVAQLLADPRIGYLAEVMDFPAVIRRDPNIMRKLDAAKRHQKPIDGHAPGLIGEHAANYFASGIGTDHECVSLDEALQKIALGCSIAIREGSAARNFEALHSLIDSHPNSVMLCSDDKHPDELLTGHIDQLVSRGIAAGLDVFHLLQAACINPIQHYRLPVGQLRVGDPADFVEVDNLQEFNVLRTWIDGKLVARRGESLIGTVPVTPLNQFRAKPVSTDDVALPAVARPARVIEVIDGQLITHERRQDVPQVAGKVVTDTDSDVLKLVVVNRYLPNPPAVALVHGFGLREGAFASSVAHDSHNVIAVGVEDDQLCAAINHVIEAKGGLAAVNGHASNLLPLPVAGLMSDRPIEEVAENYQALDRIVKGMGCSLRAPFMTLSFVALLVIPSLKLSDKGLFDVDEFAFTSIFPA